MSDQVKTPNKLSHDTFQFNACEFVNLTTKLSPEQLNQEPEMLISVNPQLVADLLKFSIMTDIPKAPTLQCTSDNSDIIVWW